MNMDALNRRLEALERQILGPDKNIQSNTSAVSALTNLAKDCGNAVERKGDRIAPLLRRTGELEKYLDPSFAETHGGVPTAVKVDLILASAEKLKQVHDQLSKVSEKQSVINGEGFQRIQPLEPKLMELVSYHLEQEGRGNELSQETIELIQQYDEIMQSIAKSFAQLDQTLKEAEENKDKR